MLKSQYLERSPIRIMEKSINGGLGQGNLGVFTSRKGVGKTGCLIHVAIDAMLNGKKVLHVSFNENPNHISKWYKIIFGELLKTYKLENTNFYDEISQNHIIMNFSQGQITVPEVGDRIAMMIENAKFIPAIFIIDGFSFEPAIADDLLNFKSIAQKHDCEMWFSATLHRHQMELDHRGIPAPVNRFYDFFSVIIMLKPENDYIHLKLLKDGNSTDLEQLRLKLDPHTLLISNRRV